MTVKQKIIKIIKEELSTVNENFFGDDDLTFETIAQLNVFQDMSEWPVWDIYDKSDISGILTKYKSKALAILKKLDANSDKKLNPDLQYQLDDLMDDSGMYDDLELYKQNAAKVYKRQLTFAAKVLRYYNT